MAVFFKTSAKAPITMNATPLSKFYRLFNIQICGTLSLKVAASPPTDAIPSWPWNAKIPAAFENSQYLRPHAVLSPLKELPQLLELLPHHRVRPNTLLIPPNTTSLLLNSLTHDHSSNKPSAPHPITPMGTTAVLMGFHSFECWCSMILLERPTASHHHHLRQTLHNNIICAIQPLHRAPPIHTPFRGGSWSNVYNILGVFWCRFSHNLPPTQYGSSSPHHNPLQHPSYDMYPAA